MSNNSRKMKGKKVRRIGINGYPEFDKTIASLWFNMIFMV